jgi:hypothetical protein
MEEAAIPRDVIFPAATKNERAIEPQIMTIYRRFGLNDRQIAIIAHAQPKRDYYYQSRLGNRLFDLGLGPIALAFAGWFAFFYRIWGTVSPSFSVAWSAPTGGETPSTL